MPQVKLSRFIGHATLVLLLHALLSTTAAAQQEPDPSVNQLAQDTTEITPQAASTPDPRELDPANPYTQFTFAFEHLETAKQLTQQRDAELHKAITLFEQAAQQGYLNAQLTLAYIYMLGDGVPVNYEQAHRWYFMAAEQHHNAQAQATIAAMYFDGLGVPKSDEAGLYWAMQAAQQSNPLGLLLAARAYHYGKGVYPQLSRAQELYQQACEAGRQDACTTSQHLNKATPLATTPH